MAYPATRRRRVLYDTAKRVRDEVGKGQETLRVLGPVKLVAAGAETVRALLGVPTVPIRIVDVKVVGETAANLTTLDVLAPAAYDSAPAAGNQLITQIAAAPADDTMVYGAVLPLANRVGAEQPIVAVMVTGGAVTSVEVQVDYILCDEERSY